MAKRSIGLIWYLAISFAITWGSVFAIRQLQLPLPGQSISTPNPLVGLLSILATFGPAIGAIVVLKWVTREGFKDAGLRPNFRAGWKYYLAALFYPLAVISVALGVAAISGAAIAPLSAQLLAKLMPLYGAALVWTLIYFGEECGYSMFSSGESVLRWM